MLDFDGRQFGVMQMQVQKNQVLSQLHVAEAEEIAKRKWDVASLREMQKMVVRVREDGAIFLEKELFGGGRGELLAVSFKKAEIFICPEREKDKILCIQFVNMQGNEWTLHFCLRKLSDRYINQKFTGAGISFGFKKNMESEVRRLLVETLGRNSSACLVPEKHGWYEKDGKVKFAFPNEKTWKELEAYV